MERIAPFKSDRISQYYRQAKRSSKIEVRVFNGESLDISGRQVLKLLIKSTFWVFIKNL
ncbi:hypothetical protein [Spirulina sp. 06S082]|uniref:hypothetical protein n=1 Tax=Spirulina sp. 06S082 TaxID=3110248 RepID=UPI002B2210D3|nr:hypothetical protein [Spirulina sp. 06S082]MEA5469684.1 hypothetical protein [Spirulina sp. 06S082]